MTIFVAWSKRSRAYFKMSETTAPPPEDSPRRGRGWKIAGLSLLGAVVLVVGGWLIGYVIDNNSHNGKVMRNVTLTFPDGRYEDAHIGGLSKLALQNLLSDIAEEHASRPVRLQMESGDQTFTMGDLGFGIDVDRTVNEALHPGRIGNFFERASKWVGSMLEPHKTQVYYLTDLNTDSEFFTDIADITISEPKDAQLAPRGTQRSFQFTPGEEGAIICGNDIAQGVRQAADPFADEIVVNVPTTELRTRTDNNILSEQIDLLNEVTSLGLTVHSANTSHRFSPAIVRSWLQVELEVTGRQIRTCADLAADNSETSNSETSDTAPASSILRVSLIKDETIHEALEERFIDDIIPGDFGVITIIDGEPVAMDTSPGSRCCAPFDTDNILHALFASRDTADPDTSDPDTADPAAPDTPDPDTPEPTASDPDASDPDTPSISVPVRVDPDLMPDFAGDGEIREIVGEFTTMHRPDTEANPQPRVTNIQRFADLVRGAIIEPGDIFSLNDHVGNRTEAKGFVEAGVIYKGVFTEDVGGGVSQFATTFFNAAFFAGLDFLEYQSHSLYISRYPYGREATISWPYVDLVVQNNTPYPMLIWPTYTADSISVSIYSTKWAEVEQTDQVSIAEGECTRVHTERTLTYTDGTQKVDRVVALYRPTEGINCLGRYFVEPPDCQPNEIGIDTNDDEWPDACQPCPPGQIADRTEVRNNVCRPRSEDER